MTLSYIPDELLYQIYNYVNPMTIMHSIIINKRINTLLLDDKNVYKQYAIIKFFTQNLDKVFWQILSANPIISDDFCEYYINYIYIKHLSGNNNISEEFLTKYFNKINWKLISSNTNMSEKFFEANIKKVNWYNLSRNSNMSEAFFEEYITMVNNNGLCENINLSEAFFNKHPDKIVRIYLGNNTNISEKYFIENNFHWRQIVFNKNVSIEYLNKIIPENVRWHLLCNENITEELIYSIMDLKRDQHWYHVCSNKGISGIFLIKYIDYININNRHRICEYNTNLTENFFGEHDNIFTIEYCQSLCSNNNISIEYFKKNIGHINWKRLCGNNFDLYLNR
jgi:hypothetical protein